MISRLLIGIFLVTFAYTGKAENKKLPVPRFASIKANEVNARTGPEVKCPIEWVFVKKGEPVEIIAESEQWRQIRDIKGEGGWVHSSVLSSKRSVIIIGEAYIHLLKKPKDNDKEVIAHVSPQVRCQLNKCRDKWCLLRCKGTEGWALRKDLWGIYQQEQL